MEAQDSTVRFLTILQTIPTPVLIVLVLWVLFWSGLALWHSAQRGNYVWFIVFLLVHTVGILEIIYLFGVLRLRVGELFSSKM
ncbi:MAG TPA: DUF5652 family protein [Candidatus Paceibacterota bacterium]|nr:DUF5652 family protein [Candidatus Paceibacterota bacterium]